jgi:hypothetical protein
MKEHDRQAIWIDEQKYYLALVIFGICIAISLMGLIGRKVADIKPVVIALGFFISLYLLFINYLLPVTLYKDRIRLARYRKWIFFPRTDVYFKDIKSIKISTINKTGHKEIGSTRSSGASAMNRMLIIKDNHGAEYMNIIFDRKVFKDKLKQIAPYLTPE